MLSVITSYNIGLVRSIEGKDVIEKIPLLSNDRSAQTAVRTKGAVNSMGW